MNKQLLFCFSVAFSYQLSSMEQEAPKNTEVAVFGNAAYMADLTTFIDNASKEKHIPENFFESILSKCSQVNFDKTIATNILPDEQLAVISTAIKEKHLWGRSKKDAKQTLNTQFPGIAALLNDDSKKEDDKDASYKRFKTLCIAHNKQLEQKIVNEVLPQLRTEVSNLTNVNKEIVDLHTLLAQKESAAQKLEEKVGTLSKQLAALTTLQQLELKETSAEIASINAFIDSTKLVLSQKQQELSNITNTSSIKQDTDTLAKIKVLKMQIDELDKGIAALQVKKTKMTRRYDNKTWDNFNAALNFWSFTK